LKCCNWAKENLTLAWRSQICNVHGEGGGKTATSITSCLKVMETCH